MRILLLIFGSALLCNVCIGQPLGNNNKNFNLKDCKNISKEDTIFRNPDIPASYPGGEKEWQRFLKKHLDPTVGLDNGAPEGIYEITVRIIVNRDGAICSVRPETNIGHGIEHEIIRVIRKSKRWDPGLIKGVPVISYRRLTVTYDLVRL